MLRPSLWCFALCTLLHSGFQTVNAADPVIPAPQHFRQEIAVHWELAAGLPTGPVQLLLFGNESTPKVFVAGKWFAREPSRWVEIPGLENHSENHFVFPGEDGIAITIALPWRQMRQCVRFEHRFFLATSSAIAVFSQGKTTVLDGPALRQIRQIAVRHDGVLHVASASGLHRHIGERWEAITATDDFNRVWSASEVLGVGFDGRQQLWIATRAGVGCQTSEGWRFYEGKDGLPWNEFTCVAGGQGNEVWFGTRLGLIRFDGVGFHYRQGPRWLPNDEVTQVAVDPAGTAWAGTAAGPGCIKRRAMTLAEKAEHYELEIERYIKRTPLGYVAEARLAKVADKSSADPDDSDNDGLWTAMYGAGECFAYAATRDTKARERAAKAFEALRFLQKVTQGGSNSPPKGYVARTVRSRDLPDPNQGRAESDRNIRRTEDRLWKVYEPRWPRSADGHWFWKSDTSSDELDGHFFFYALYFDFCAESKEEKARVREVVRDLADHLVSHHFALIDHDGSPTRWGNFRPDSLNKDRDWWVERGLNSLSMLTYLAVAHHVTGDPKYADASRELIDRHHYDQNAMVTKVQMGAGSGNQSDDEMAFMCFYSLLRCSRDEALKTKLRYSFFASWALEQPERNPFFHFAYAAHGLRTQVENPFGTFATGPWNGWLEESMETLRGFSLDRLNWPHKNSHRLDIQALGPQRSEDLYSPAKRPRGARVDGKVLPVENRHFNHWNTDPWQLDYGGSGNELAAGTVFLLPYYMGLHHRFIEKP